MVSVLFADVRNYTEMTGRRAPADMADRIASLQRWAIQEVTRRRGVVDKFAGDSVMATFNVAGHSVDHTLQAVQAAIGIIDKAWLADLPVGAGGWRSGRLWLDGWPKAANLKRARRGDQSGRQAPGPIGRRRGDSERGSPPAG